MAHRPCTVQLVNIQVDELPRVTPALLRRADDMCRRRLAHEFTSGRKLSPLGERAFEVSARLTNDAILWHRGNVPDARTQQSHGRRSEGSMLTHGFPDPADLEPEQRAVYRAGARGYVHMFGDGPVEVHDLDWTTELPDVGVRLVGPVGIPVVVDAVPTLRVLRVGGRARRMIDSVEMRFFLLRAGEWAGDVLHVVVADLLDTRSEEYELDVAQRLPEARAWLDTRVALLRERADTRVARVGADCRDCQCIPGCPQLTRAT